MAIGGRTGRAAALRRGASSGSRLWWRSVPASFSVNGARACGAALSLLDLSKNDMTRLALQATPRVNPRRQTAARAQVTHLAHRSCELAVLACSHYETDL